MPYELDPIHAMVIPLVPKDRVISKFAQAFHPDATPHQKINFHPRVKSACAQNKTGTVGIKICKAVVVGDVAVGKTSLVNRFCHQVFDRDYKATIGVDFEVEKFSILGVPFNLQIWDTAGQERFKCIAASYYRSANLVIVVFDLADPESLSNARQWKKDACKNSDDPLVFLVGTKKDILANGPYKQMEAEAVKLANEINAEYWAVSSLTGEHVQDFFFRAVCLTFDKQLLQETDHIENGRQIGNSLIKIDSTGIETSNLYEKSEKKMKCC